MEITMEVLQMRKRIFFRFLILISLFLMPRFSFAVEEPKIFHSYGVVTAVDPIFYRITIKHKPIKGFPSEETSVFIVATKSLIDGIAPRDIVHFSISDQHGDVRLIEIKKTATTPPPLRDKGEIISQTAHHIFERADNVTAGNRDPVSAVVGGTAKFLDNTVTEATRVYREEKKITDHTW